MAMDAGYARLLALEGESQALRDQIRDMQQLLQVKDSEISLKFQLIHAKDRENAQARARLQWLEFSARQAEAGAAKAACTFDREVLLGINSALCTLGLVGKPEALEHLSCALDPDGLSPRDTAPEVTDLASVRTPPETLPSAKGRTRERERKHNVESLVWRERRRNEGEDLAALGDAAPSDAAPASTESAGTPLVPDVNSVPSQNDEIVVGSCELPHGAQTMPDRSRQEAGALPPVGGPSKRLPIVDPGTGKQIELHQNSNLSAREDAPASWILANGCSDLAPPADISSLPFSPTGPSGPSTLHPPAQFPVPKLLPPTHTPPLPPVESPSWAPLDGPPLLPASTPPPPGASQICVAPPPGSVPFGRSQESAPGGSALLAPGSCANLSPLGISASPSPERGIAERLADTLGGAQVREEEPRESRERLVPGPSAVAGPISVSPGTPLGVSQVLSPLDSSLRVPSLPPSPPTAPPGSAPSLMSTVPVAHSGMFAGPPPWSQSSVPSPGIFAPMTTYVQPEYPPHLAHGGLPPSNLLGYVGYAPLPPHVA